MREKPEQISTKHLKPNTRRWVRGAMVQWELEAHHVRLLIAAGEAWDRAEAARKILDKDGLTYQDRFGQPKARPEAVIERDSKTLFARLIRELDLDISPPAEASKPPALRSIRR